MQRRHVVWVSARGHPATRTVPTAIVVVVVAVVTSVVGRGCRRSRGQSERRRRRRCGVVHQVLLHVRLNVGGGTGTGTAVRRTQRPRRRRRLPHTHTQQSHRSVSSFATLAITSRSVSDSSDTSWRCSSSCFFVLARDYGSTDSSDCLPILRSLPVFQCRLYLHWGPGQPQTNWAPRYKVFTGFPLQLIFAKVKAEN